MLIKTVFGLSAKLLHEARQTGVRIMLLSYSAQQRFL